MEEGSVSLASVSFLVLDEADRMLDMGFERDMRAIIGATMPAARGRRTAMFSATWPVEVRKIASDFLQTPVTITVGTGSLHASSNVTQIVEVVEERERGEEGLSSSTSRASTIASSWSESECSERLADDAAAAAMALAMAVSLRSLANVERAAAK